MKRIAILGSTGSIGQNALEIVRNLPDKFKVTALSANSNAALLLKQIREFRPSYVCIGDVASAERLRGLLGKTRLLTGKDGFLEIVAKPEIEEVLIAISGSAALEPLLEAIKNNKQIALANKEALVMAGSIIMEATRRKKVKLIPIDSEQSAIWQCVEGKDKEKIRQIYLTASGGPFRNISAKAMRNVSVEMVLNHPRWKMGKKVTVDSATLMNKGLELIEAMFLFDVSLDKIRILIHPQAIIHSMVEFIDGIILAQLSITDMRIPIQYALTYPERLHNALHSVDFCSLKKLDFEKPDCKRFPCLELAYAAAKKMGTAPCVLNAANEVSVEEFLKGKIKFYSIPKVIEKVLSKHINKEKPTLEDIREIDSWARRKADEVINRCN
ncbi:MAG: 1-deoxy-D-xylulose-5-phosphate reductoisomerase [Candidatus Omnitrophica bacterium]|nr:1-deoxy-D-xylulose-5-phosphate reductoisomerase [Candidatus Omnitrophota bacterium]